MHWLARIRGCGGRFLGDSRQDARHKKSFRPRKGGDHTGGCSAKCIAKRSRLRHKPRHKTALRPHAAIINDLFDWSGRGDLNARPPAAKGNVVNFVAVGSLMSSIACKSLQRPWRTMSIPGLVQICPVKPVVPRSIPGALSLLNRYSICFVAKPAIVN